MNDDLTRRHAVWLARSMARAEMSPLNATDILALEDAVDVTRVRAGTVIVAAGSSVDAVHVVRDGRIHLAVRTAATGRQTIGTIGAGGVVADIPMFTGTAMPFDAIADVESTLLTIRRTRLLQLLASSPSLSLRWTTSVAQRLEEAQRRVVTLVTKDLAAQVATLLVDLRGEEDGTWVVRLPHQTIADLLGARRQSVSRVLGQMRRDGLVLSRYGAVEIADLDRVIRLAGDVTDVDLRDSA